MYVHALHTVHALPDMRVAAGRLRDGVSHLPNAVTTLMESFDAADRSDKATAQS
jgi:hypothetical protein